MTSPAQQQIDRIAAASGAAASAAGAFYTNAGLLPSVPNPIGDIAGAGAEVARIASSITRAGVWISNPRNWIRIAYVTGGALLIVSGVISIGIAGKQRAIQSTGVTQLIGIGTRIASKGKVGNATPAA